MEKIELPESAKYIIDFVEGVDINDKLRNLVRGDLERRLKICCERIFDYEKKYGISFREFETEWQKDEIPDKYSYEIEHDYLEWESLEEEHRLLLYQLKKLKDER